MAELTQYTLDGSSSVLLSVLSEISQKVEWAESAAELYRDISQVYDTPSDELHTDLLSKIKEVEKYVSLDIERHIALGLCRSPYYLRRLQKLLEQALSLMADKEANLRNVDHLTAEFQALCVEYGFCASMEAIYDTDEADLRLQQLSNRLKVIEQPSHDASLALVELHSIVAALSGMKQAMTPGNIMKMEAKFRAVHNRIAALENNISCDQMKSNSKLFTCFLASQHLLKRDFVSALKKPDPIDTINDHVIHPGTRGWILDRLNRWMVKSQKKVFFLCGKQGSGKTALASALCKLHNHSIVARHFFSVSHTEDLYNTTTGLILSITRDLCSVLPEYLNFLDDNVTKAEIEEKADQPWKVLYDVLLKRPLQALYGTGKNASSNAKRKVIIVDSLDEATFLEWTNVKELLQCFINDISSSFCILVTVRTKHSGAFNIDDEDNIEKLQFENRAWQSRHIKDVEIYISSSVGAILSGEDERGTPQHAKVDQSTLQNTMDELLKCSAGRFDYAISLMEAFAREMASGGQFLGSIKRAMMPMKQSHGEEYEAKIGSFASPYRAYRDKEGRAVDVRVMRQSHYLMDKSRVALIRGRHQIKTLTQNGN